MSPPCKASPLAMAVCKLPNAVVDVIAAIARTVTGAAAAQIVLFEPERSAEPPISSGSCSLNSAIKSPDDCRVAFEVAAAWAEASAWRKHSVAAIVLLGDA